MFVLQVYGESPEPANASLLWKELPPRRLAFIWADVVLAAQGTSHNEKELILRKSMELSIKIDRESRTAQYLQIAMAIIEDIQRGRLSPGVALPSTRDLAEELLVNRKTAMQAYDELIAQGWLASEKGRGTFVSPKLPVAQPASFAYRPVNTSGVPEIPDYRLPGQRVQIDTVLPERGVLAFDDGLPDTRLAPVAIYARAYRKSLLGMSRSNRLVYGDPRGSEALRSSVSRMLNADRGLNTTPDTICITRGSQMAIFIAARILTQPGDVVVMETLSYPPARDAFLAHGAKIETVGIDERGMRVDLLERVCRKHRVRCVYLTPHHQFPTTVLLPPERRLRLLTLADQFGFAIIEDDYDHEYHFAHRPMLPLASSDQWGKVAYIGSLSKVFAPGLRSGYIAGAKRLIDRAAEEVLLIDRQGDPAAESAIAELIDTGEMQRHSRKVLQVYESRRAQLAELLTHHFGSSIKFDLPDGGLAFWARFDESIDTAKLVAAGRLNHVRLLSGAAYSMSGELTSGIRLGFASLNSQELEEAVKRTVAASRQIQKT